MMGVALQADLSRQITRTLVMPLCVTLRARWVAQEIDFYYLMKVLMVVSPPFSQYLPTRYFSWLKKRKHNVLREITDFEKLVSMENKRVLSKIHFIFPDLGMERHKSYRVKRNRDLQMEIPTRGKAISVPERFSIFDSSSY